MDGLQWAISQYVRIINVSTGANADAYVHWLDRAFDYWTRQHFCLVVKSAGNTGDYITSPGKAWNVLTVGAIADNNNANWSDDQMWSDSAYLNPDSSHDDREKPEVVAVGKDVRVLGSNNTLHSWDGTSIATPQVAGLAALLVDRNASLINYPEALRAIIMASATHNIEVPSIIVKGQGDLKDGAGAVNADLADTVAYWRGNNVDPCYTSCWWRYYISNSVFPVGTDEEYLFDADQGDLIRVAIAWYSHADTLGYDYSDWLSTDLDLRIKDPNGNYVSGASSVSLDNNYEMVQFPAPKDGGHRIVVHKSGAAETSNYLGIALVKIPLPYRVYLPAAMKNYP